jgi:hypothetical protein
MALDARRTEGSVVGLQKHHAHNVVADVALSLQLLRVVLLIRKLRADVKHDFDIAPVRVHRVETCQVMNRVCN